MKAYGINPVALGLDVNHMANDYCLCNCVFHDDSKPSMVFYYETGSYYCFGCGAYGDCEKIIDVTGGYIEKKLIEVNNKNDNTLKEYWNILTRLPINDSDEYLINRGITKEQINKYKIMSDSEKIVIPFLNDNEITGIKMRWKKPNGRVKYMNFGLQPLLYGDDKFYEGNVVFVIEGILGFFNFNKHGIKCISTLSSNRIANYNDIFSNYNKTQFRIMFDPDNAGYYGASKLLFLNRGNDNVVGLNLFYDVDLMSEKQFKEVVATDEITKDYFWYINNFSVEKDKKFYETAFKKFISNNIKRMD